MQSQQSTTLVYLSPFTNLLLLHLLVVNPPVGIRGTAPTFYNSLTNNANSQTFNSSLFSTVLLELSLLEDLEILLFLEVSLLVDVMLSSLDPSPLLSMEQFKSLVTQQLMSV
jgi:hypothetical protein